MNDDELRAHLRAAVPEPPDASTWATEARVRHARRSGRAMTAGVAVVVLAVIGAFVWPSLNGAGRVAVPAATPTPTTGSVHANPDCTGTLAASKTLAPRGGNAVLRVSLCPRSDGPTFTTPTDTLEEGATALFDTIAALPAERRRDPDCSAADDRRYLVVFTLADDSRRVLEAATANACGVEPGSANARRWSGLLSALEKAWTAQRAWRSQAQVAAGCVPYDRPGLFRFDISQALAGALCVADRAGTVTGSVSLSPEELGLLRTDIAAHSAPAMNRDSPRDGPVLTLAGPWNDPLVLWRVEGGQWYAFVPDAASTQLYWQPGAEAAAALQTLLGRVTPSATSTGTADLMPAACRGLDQSAGPLPTTAQRLRLCPADPFTLDAYFPMLTVLDGARASTVLAALAAQKPLDTPFCKADGGAAFRLVAETDGVLPVVMKLQLFGCGETGTTDDVRTGAETVLRAFVDQVPGQRSIDGPAEPPWTPVSLCRALGTAPRSVVPTGVDAMTTATLCRYSAKGKADSMTPLSAADADAVLTDIATHSAKGGRLPCPASQPGTEPHAWRLALSNGYGDAILVEPSCAGRFFYAAGDGSERAWLPSSSVAKLLDRITAR